MYSRAARKRSRSRLRRSQGIRGGLAALALACGYMSITQSLAFAIGKSAPDRGHALAPYDGRIAARFAEKLGVVEATPAKRKDAVRVAREALRDAPLAVPAITVLALQEAITGDVGTARRLFAHSDMLSRRDLTTRIWLIEDAVQREDIKGAIDNYDIALRTSRNAPDRLFPILASASSDPAIAAVLVPTLAKRPPWGEAFLHYLSNSGPDPRAAATFFRQLDARRVPIAETSQASVVNALVIANAFDDAWSYYRTLRSHADRRRSRDPNFADQVAVPTAFDWTPRMSDAGVTASIQRTAANGLFDFATPSTVGGIVLEQLQLLPVGRYQLVGRSMGVEQPRDSRPYWVLVCTDGRELGRIDVPNSSVNNGLFEGVLIVPSSCPAQILRLVARPSSLISGVTGQIDRLALRPMGQAR